MELVVDVDLHIVHPVNLREEQSGPRTGVKAMRRAGGWGTGQSWSPEAGGCWLLALRLLELL